MPRKPKNPRKGFTRSEKEWEESIAKHIGKFIDRLTVDDAITLGVGVWAALHTGWPFHAITGMVGYRLARSDNIISGGAGVGVLAALGLVGLGDATEFKLFPTTPAKGLQITGPFAVKVVG